MSVLGKEDKDFRWKDCLPEQVLGMTTASGGDWMAVVRRKERRIDLTVKYLKSRDC